MMRLLLTAGALLFMTNVTHALAFETQDDPTGDPAVWRDKGPEGFAELYESMANEIDAYRTYKAQGIQNNQYPEGWLAQLESSIRALDRVARQRDAYASGLFWYTDLDAAIAQARRTGRPILSLRMLGNLDEEYSCANSRFFRTVLYADEALSDTLRDGFVLHWQSVRPVPVITIDMGDGRQIKRTITGNSAHYVLDNRGRVVDVLPGLYGARTFERLITEAAQLAAEVAGMESTRRDDILVAWHRTHAEQLDERWTRVAADALGTDLTIAPIANDFPNAIEAGRMTDSKKRVEAVVVRQVIPPLPADADSVMWNRVAATYAEEAQLDSGSRRLMREKTVPAEQAAARVTSKRIVEDPMMRMIRNFESSIALDTARNEHLLHRQIHDWFVTGQATQVGLDALNSRVYAELFLTPEEDPWLGLVPADTYSAIETGGLSSQSQTANRH